VQVFAEADLILSGEASESRTAIHDLPHAREVGRIKVSAEPHHHGRKTDGAKQNEPAPVAAKVSVAVAARGVVGGVDHLTAKRSDDDVSRVAVDVFTEVQPPSRDRGSESVPRDRVG